MYMYYQGRYDTYQVIADMLSIMTNNMTKKSNALRKNTGIVHGRCLRLKILKNEMLVYSLFNRY